MTTLTTDYRTDYAIVTDSDDADTRYIVMHDIDTESPTHWGRFDIYVYRASYRSMTDESRANESPIARAFFSLMDRYNDEEYVLPIVKRYMRIFHDADLGDSVTTYGARGYSQGDWWDVLIVCDDLADDAEACGEVWETWARGDVYFVRAEHRITCELPDYCHAHDDDSHWSEVNDQGIDSIALGGIYADDAESAVTQYLAII